MLLRHMRVGTILLGLGMSSGCYAGVHDLEKFGQDGGGDAGEDGADGDDGEDGAGDDGLGPADEMPTATTRFFRLTHAQWESTVQDLFGLSEPTGLSSEFRADPYVGGFIFDNNALALEVDQALWGGYQRAAVDVAELVTADSALVTRLAPTDAPDEATRARDFVTSFGMRAFRRPLTDAEVATHLELFEQGKTLYDDMAGFEAGMRLVLEAMLQSPYFLYRVEVSNEVEGDVIPLDSWEIASRLSYFLWNSMPDEELLAAAAADELRDVEVVRAHALRLLESPRAQAVVERFHHQLLQVDRFASASPSPAFYPDAPEDIGMLAIEEHDRFVRHTVFEQDGSWRDLLTSTETFVNSDLAKLYGLPSEYGEEFELADLDPTERRGLFTQIGFLVANSTSANPDPIHRGVFLAKHIACHAISAPPDNIPPIPAPDETQTNREAIVALTEVPGSECVACHSTLINPFGFPFESYDSTGAFRTIDNDKPVDASAHVTLLGTGRVAVQNAIELVEALADDSEVHACYAQHWLEFAMARPHTDVDEALTERLAEGSLGDMSVKELLVELAVSRPFLTRSAEEM